MAKANHKALLSELSSLSDEALIRRLGVRCRAEGASSYYGNSGRPQHSLDTEEITAMKQELLRRLQK